MDKQEWLDKAAKKYKDNGLFEKGDAMISKADAKQWSEDMLMMYPDALDEDPEQFVDKQDLSNLLKDED